MATSPENVERTQEHSALPAGWEPPRARKPPKWLFRYLISPLMRRLLRTRFGARGPGKLLLLLTYTGRKSGRRITTPAGYHRQGDSLLIFTHSPWWHNFRGGAPVTVLVAGEEHQGRAESTRDPDEVLPPFEAVLREKGQPFAARFGITLQDGRLPTMAELRETIRAQKLALVRVTLSKAPGVHPRPAESPAS